MIPSPIVFSPPDTFTLMRWCFHFSSRYPLLSHHRRPPAALRRLRQVDGPVWPVDRLRALAVLAPSCRRPPPRPPRPTQTAQLAPLLHPPPRLGRRGIGRCWLGRFFGRLNASRLADPDTGHLGGPDASLLAGSDAGYLAGPDAGLLAGSDTGRLTGPDTSRLAGRAAGRLAGCLAGGSDGTGWPSYTGSYRCSSSEPPVLER